MTHTKLVQRLAAGPASFAGTRPAPFTPNSTCRPMHRVIDAGQAEHLMPGSRLDALHQRGERGLHGADSTTECSVCTAGALNHCGGAL